MNKVPVQQPDLTPKQVAIIKNECDVRQWAVSQALRHAMIETLKMVRENGCDGFSEDAQTLQNQRPFVRLQSTVYIDQETKDEIVKVCEQAGLTVADYIRWSVHKTYQEA